MQRTGTEDGQTVLKCISCGREHAAPSNGASPAAPEAALDWQAEVRRQIATAVERWKDAAAAKEQAERLCKALVAYGAASPELPWKAAQSHPGASKGVPRNWGNCVLCGVALSGTQTIRKLDDGRKACRNEAACAERQVKQGDTQ